VIHRLDGIDLSRRGPRHAPAVLILELHAAHGSVAHRGEEERRPDARDDGADGDDEDLGAGHDELLAGADDKGLLGRGDDGLREGGLLGEGARDERCVGGG
jgi:hypothetical protein